MVEKLYKDVNSMVLHVVRRPKLLDNLLDRRVFQGKQFISLVSRQDFLWFPGELSVVKTKPCLCFAWFSLLFNLLLTLVTLRMYLLDHLQSISAITKFLQP